MCFLLLVAGDTDSFFLALHCNKHISLSDILISLQQYSDSSNYPSDHPLYSVANKARLGCFNQSELQVGTPDSISETRFVILVSV